LIKKALVFIVPLAAVAAVMVAPMSSSADTFFKCPPGVTDHHYCTKFKKCVVPHLKGKTVQQARVALRRHDCRLGKVHHKQHHGGKPGRIYKSAPKAGTRHKQGKKVNVFVKSRHHHGHKH
jgi:hypothetical protein